MNLTAAFKLSQVVLSCLSQQDSKTGRMPCWLVSLHWLFQLYTVCIHLTKKTADLSTRLRISFMAPSDTLFGVWPSLGYLCV